MFTVVRWSAKFRSLWSRSEKAVKVQGKKAWRYVKGPFRHHWLMDCNANGNYNNYRCDINYAI
jgi:hypothetical protein